LAFDFAQQLAASACARSALRSSPTQSWRFARVSGRLRVD
jgi:hypothetical protein